MSELNDVIARMEQNKPYVYETILRDLKSIRDSGVYVAQGTREWAYAMAARGEKIRHPRVAGTLQTCGDADVVWCGQVPHPAPEDGYVISVPPPRLVERGPVEPWEACKAWHEGKNVRHEAWDSGEWHNKTTGRIAPTFGGRGKWFVMEPA